MFSSTEFYLTRKVIQVEKGHNLKKQKQKPGRRVVSPFLVMAAVDIFLHFMCFAFLYVAGSVVNM